MGKNPGKKMELLHEFEPSDRHAAANKGELWMTPNGEMVRLKRTETNTVNWYRLKSASDREKAVLEALIANSKGE